MENKSGNTWHKTFKNSDGSYDTFSWSLEDSFVMGAGQIAIAIFIGTLVSFLFSTFTLLIAPISTSGKQLGNYILSSLVIIYSLADYHFGWIGWYWWSPHPNLYTDIITFNASILILNIFLIGSGGGLLTTLKRNKLPIILWYLIIGVVIFILFNFLQSIVPEMITMHVAEVVEKVPLSPWGESWGE